MPSTPPPKRERRTFHMRPVDPNDPHYPRPSWFHVIRAVLEALWVVGILGYAGNSIWSLIGVFSNGGDVTAQAIFDALYVGRLYTLARTNPLAAGGIVVGIVGLTLLAYLARRDSLRQKAVLAARAEYEKLAAYYTLKLVRGLDPVRDGIQLARYVPDVYLKRRDSAGADAETEARHTLAAVHNVDAASPDAPLGILVTGRPTLGKTRFAWEVLRDTLPDALFVSWSHGAAPDFDYSLAAGKTVALWLDNAQEYANDREAPALNELPARFGISASRLIVVATSRDGPDLDAVMDKLAPLTRRLIPIPLADITPPETDELAGELEREGQTVDRGAVDGTPGALLLGVAAMRDQRYPALPDGAQAVLKAMKLLRSAGTYDYPARRVSEVARGIFTLGAGRGAWDAAVDALVKSDFVRLGRAVDEEGLRALDPVADVYLEHAVRDYPAEGAAITDQWPPLQDVLTRERDADALYNLGNSYGQLRSGLDRSAPHDLRSALRHAEQCFREVLALLLPNDPNHPRAQNNLSVAIANLAELAAGGEQQGLLANAVATFRATLSASVPGTSDWALAQNNLGLALRSQARLARTGEEQRHLLAEAMEAFQAALGAATPGTTDWSARQNNLGITIQGRAELTKDQERQRLLAEAGTAFRASLKASVPNTPDWALAQNNLGSVLGEQAIMATTREEQRRLLGEAATAYSAALTVRTRESDPNGWSRTQNNLGLAFRSQARLARTGEEQRHLLAEAMEAFQAALGAATVNTLYWALVLYNVALLLVDTATIAAGSRDFEWACSDMRMALHSVSQAQDVFRDSSPAYEGHAVRLRHDIEGRLAELRCVSE